MQSQFWDLSSTFSSLEKILMTSLISCFTLKLYLNFLTYCIFLKSLWQSSVSSEIFVNQFGHFRGMFRNMWPSEKFWRIFGNRREVHGNLRKIV